MNKTTSSSPDPEDEDSDFNLMKYLSGRSCPRKWKQRQRHFAKKYLHETDGISAFTQRTYTWRNKITCSGSRICFVTDTTIQLQNLEITSYLGRSTEKFLEARTEYDKTSTSSPEKKTHLQYLATWISRAPDLPVETIRKSSEHPARTVFFLET